MVVKMVVLLFFSSCQALKAWFELSRVDLYRNDRSQVKAGKQKLLRVSRRFELSIGFELPNK